MNLKKIRDVEHHSPERYQQVYPRRIEEALKFALRPEFDEVVVTEEDHDTFSFEGRFKGEGFLGSLRYEQGGWNVRRCFVNVYLYSSEYSDEIVKKLKEAFAASSLFDYYTEQNVKVHVDVDTYYEGETI